MRVIIYEEVKVDVSKAEKYGEIVYLFTEHDTRPSIWETEAFLAACSRRLSELKFSADDDYFAVVGSSVPLTLITNLIARKYKESKFLFWHSGIRDYLPRVIKGDTNGEAS